VQERLEREFDIDLITTAPACGTGSHYGWGNHRSEQPHQVPRSSEIKQIEEPIIDATVITREEYLAEF